MLYQLYKPQTKKRKSFSYIGWFLIPVFFGFLAFGFLTHSIDDVILNVNQTLKSIPQRLEKLASEKAQFFYDDNKNYLEGISIKEIVRGGNKYEIEEFAKLPEIDAESYVVGDILTGEIIIEKNANLELPIASLTKLMTASVALDELKETHIATVSQRATLTESSRGMLRANEKIQVSDLLYPLLLVSSNDASEVLAETFGRKYFIQSMNRRASELGMMSTRFDDPSGLSEYNISTAKDLFKLSEYLFNHHNNVFEITKLKEYTQGGRVWSNANRFAGTLNYEGGKTGYTSKAHRTGVALFRVPIEGYGDRIIAITLLKTNNRAEDYSKLLSFVNEHVHYITPQQKSLSEKENEAVATLAFMGDIMFDRGVKTSVYKNWNGDYSKLFENLTSLREADISFVNLEGPISDQGKNVGSKYSFRFEPKVKDALKNAGIDIVSFANNHVGDWSLVAFQDTLTHLQSVGILFTGAGETKHEASRVAVIEAQGIRVGFLGFSDKGPNWLEAKENQAGQLLASDPQRISYIQEAKEKVDILVVSYHWGEEYKEHNKRQEDLAYSSIDAGADLIIGHHPHVIQALETYKGGLIAYSLGNAIFDQYFSKETMEGMLLTVTVNPHGIVGYETKKVKLDENYQPQKPEKIQSSVLTASVGNFNDILDTIISNKKYEDLCPEQNTRSKNLFLFNVSQENKVPDNFIPQNLVPIPDSHIDTNGRSICITDDTLLALYAMYKDAREDGVNIVPTSGYRSFDTQEQLYTRWQSEKKDNELLSIAPPGHSEHHLGTTLDFTSEEIDFKSADESFSETKAYIWLIENAHRYGFVQSYTKNNQEITGYIPESWHWRYLGTKHAEAIKELGISTIEYLENESHFGE